MSFFRPGLPLTRGDRIRWAVTRYSNTQLDPRQWLTSVATTGVLLRAELGTIRALWRQYDL